MPAVLTFAMRPRKIHTAALIEWQRAIVSVFSPLSIGFNDGLCPKADYAEEHQDYRVRMFAVDCARRALLVRPRASGVRSYCIRR